MNADEIIQWLEANGYGWDISHTGRLRECRIWLWPDVLGRYRPNETQPLRDMLIGAADNAGFDF